MLECTCLSTLFLSCLSTVSQKLAPAGLLGLHSRLPVKPTCLLEAAALHLDVADEHSASAMQAWTVLAQTLNDAAKHLSDLQVTVFYMYTHPPSLEVSQSGS